MDFGLGLILSFTDNATGGINNAINTLNQLTDTASNAGNSLNNLAQIGAFSVVADQMGSSFIKAGSGILGMFTNILGKVQQTGGDFENFRITLNALYGDAQRAEEQVSKLLDFSIKSPFEVNDVKEMLVVLQSQGIDAFEQMTSTSKDFRQENLAWIADLMAFKPDIPVERWKLAMTNFIGSGEAKVLRNVLDMGKIEDIIGHDIGETTAERMQNLIEIVDKANIQGLADQMSATWGGVASNIDDAFSKLYLSIADNGVFEQLKSSFMGVAGAIMQLDNDEIAALGKTIAEGLNLIVAPITYLAERVNVLITDIVRLCQTNPKLVKTLMVITAVMGILITLSGVALKAMSAFGMLAIGLQSFGGTFRQITTLLRSGALSMLSTLLPLTVTLGLIYLSWKNDFGGIRTLLTNFADNVAKTFKRVRLATQMGVNDLTTMLNGLRSNGDFWSNIQAGLIRIAVAFQILKDAWSDYTISEELYVKMNALGLLPLISRILDFKWRVEHFVAGFKEGFSSVLASVVNFAKGLTKNLKGTIFDDLIAGAEKFFTLLTNNDPEAWTRLGEVVGSLVAKFLLVGVAVKVFKSVADRVSIVLGLVTKLVKVFSTISSVAKLFSPVLRAFSEIKTLLNGGMIAPATKLGSLFAKIGNIVQRVAKGFHSLFNGVTIEPITKIGNALSIVQKIVRTVSGGISSACSAIMNAITGLANTIGAPVATVAGVIIGLVLSVVTYAVTHWEEFKEKVLTIWKTIQTEASAIWNTIKNGLLSIWDNLKQAVKPLIDKFGEIRDKFSDLCSSVADTRAFKLLYGIFIVLGSVIKTIVSSALKLLIGLLSEIGRIVVDNVIPAINGILHVFSTVFQSIWNTVVSVFNAIVNIIASALGSVMDCVSGILDIIKGIFTGNLDLIWQGVTNIFNGILNFIGTTLSSILNVVKTVLNGVLEVFVSIWEAVLGVVKGVFNGIFDAITEVLSGVSSTAAEIGNKVKEGFNVAIDFITALPGKALQWGKDFIDGIVNGIKSSIGKVTEAVKGVADKIKSFLHFSVPDEGPLTEYETWMPDFMEGLAEGIMGNSDVVTEALDSFSLQIQEALNGGALEAFSQFGQKWVQFVELIGGNTQMMTQGVTTNMMTLSQSVQQMGVSYSKVFDNILKMTDKSVTGMNKLFGGVSKNYVSSATNMSTVTQNAFSKIEVITKTTFSLMVNTIVTAMDKAVNAVETSVNRIKSKMNFQWSLPELKVPHIDVSGSFNLDPPKAPQFDVKWYANGGIFDKPSMIGVGEAGREAVVPLERNTDWIGDLAGMLTAQMQPLQNFTPATSSQIVNQGGVSSDKYMTSNVSNTNSSVANNDYSVTFAEGAININCQNASPEEAQRMAKDIMQYIKRQNELDKMLKYN